MTQLSLVEADGTDPGWHDIGVDRTACGADPPKAGDVLSRTDLNRGKTGNRPNPCKFDDLTAVPDMWAQHGLVPWPLRSHDDERAVLVDVKHAFGKVPGLYDVGRNTSVLLGTVVHHTPASTAAVWSCERAAQAEVVNRPEFARAVFGDEFGENVTASVFPSTNQSLEGYLPHLGVGDGEYRSEPDVLWMNADRTRIYVGEMKVGTGRRTASFSHRQVYLPWLVARRLWPRAEVVPVFVWVPGPGEVLVSEVEYPDGDIVGAHLARTTRANVAFSALAGGGLAPVFAP